MFDGEFAGLKAIADTKTVVVPKPVTVLDNPDGGACLVMEFLDMKGLRRFSQKLGEDLATLHLHNKTLLNKKNEAGSEYVSQFGFHTTTCCGYIAQDNSWKDDWMVSVTCQFLSRMRFLTLLSKIVLLNFYIKMNLVE